MTLTKEELKLSIRNTIALPFLHPPLDNHKIEDIRPQLEKVADMLQSLFIEFAEELKPDKIEDDSMNRYFYTTKKIEGRNQAIDEFRHKLEKLKV